MYEAQNEKYRQMLKEVNSGSITYTGECDEAYDSEKAKDYALKYALARNSAFAQFPATASIMYHSV